MTKKEREKRADEKANAVDTLLKGYGITIDSTIYCIYRGGSKSGMTHYIDFYVITPYSNFSKSHGICRITYNVCQAVGSPYDKRRDCMRNEGGNMDMCFEAVYRLTRVLFPKEFNEGRQLNYHTL
jgi:hypothetical protein